MLTITTSGLTPRSYPITATLTADRAVISEAGMREARVRGRAALACLPPDLAPPSHLGIAASAPGLRHPGCDLAVALAALVDAGTIPAEYFDGVAVLGELSLGGGLRGVRGVAAMLRPESPPLFAKAIVPHVNESEARAAAPGLPIFAARSLEEVVRAALDGRADVFTTATKEYERWVDPVDFEGYAVEPHVLRALQIAAVGGFRVLLIGQKGCGMTSLARRLTTILPTPSREVLRTITEIHSLAGLVPPAGFVAHRPFRAPHHTCSLAGMVGGGDPFRPGEVTLTHGGVLFVDDVTEFRNAAVDALCDTLASGERRTDAGDVWPARPMVVASSPACPCGHTGNPRLRCVCSPKRVESFQQRIAALRHRRGPLSDMFDIIINVSSEGPRSMARSSIDIRTDVDRASLRLGLDWLSLSGGAEFALREIDDDMPIDAPRRDVELAIRERGLVQRIATVIAAIEWPDDHQITPDHVAEARRLRGLH